MKQKLVCAQEFCDVDWLRCSQFTHDTCYAKNTQLVKLRQLECKMGLHKRSIKKNSNFFLNLTWLEFISHSNVLFVFKVYLDYETPNDYLGEGTKPST